MLKHKGFSYIMKLTLATLFFIPIFHCGAELEAQCWVLKLSCLTVDLNLKVSYELVFQPGLWETPIFRFILEIKQVKSHAPQFVALRHMWFVSFW